MKKIRDYLSESFNVLFSIFIYVLYNVLYPIGFILMCILLFYCGKLCLNIYLDTEFILSDYIPLISMAIMFILNYYILKFIQEFIIMFNENIKHKIENEYNINDFTKSEQEEILSQLTPEERKYIEEQMKIEDNEIKVTLHDDEKNKPK